MISSGFLICRVVQKYPIQMIVTFGGHLGFLAVNISETVRDRAISREFLTHMVVQEYPVPRRKISIFATFDGHLGF